MLRALTTFIILLLSLCGFSQRDFIEGSVVWKTPGNDDGPEIFFEGELEMRPGQSLPRLLRSMSVDGLSGEVRAEWSSYDVQPYLGSALTRGQLAEITGEFQIKTRISQSAQGGYLVFELFPFRKKDNRIEVIHHYVISYQTNAGMLKTARADKYAANSVLADGNWYKIAIANDGIYKVDQNKLKELGVDVENLNPAAVNLYGNGGELLPFDNSAFRYDDLVKNPVFMQDGADGSFDVNDYFLFYGKGPDSWRVAEASAYHPKRFEHQKHFYSDSAYYYIRVDDSNPMRILSVDYLDQMADKTIDAFDDRQFVENENVNLVKSGREYLGEHFDITTRYSFNFPMPFLLSDSAYVEVRVASRSQGGVNRFNLSSEGTEGNFVVNGVGSSAVSDVARTEEYGMKVLPSGSELTVNLSLDKYNSSSEAWLDYVRVNGRRELRLAGNQMHFQQLSTDSLAAYAEYNLKGAAGLWQIWDITDHTHPISVAYNKTGDAASFKYPIQSGQSFIASVSSGFFVPRAVGPVQNQNLHGFSPTDLMIVTSPLFIDAANQLAELHIDEGLRVKVLTLDQIYNEFSSGNPDVTAVKMLMKMLYDRAGGNTSEKPRYLLLFGDGSIANRGHQLSKSANIITYQNWNEVSPTNSYVSDDYFAFLDDEDSEALSDKLDLGVGRIPASDVAMALGYVDKVRLYIAENTTADGDAYCIGSTQLSPYGAWRNQLVFVADDQDGSGGPNESIHMTQAEELSNKVRVSHPAYNITKIYLDAYQQVTTPGGERYPEAQEAIRRTVQNGALIVNYIGHGGEKGWAHERVLDISTCKNWTNKSSLPVFMTATCELARFDDPEFFSAGESIVMNTKGGAIAMLTTTRIVFSGANQQISRAFFDVVLDEENHADLRLGDISMLTKNDDGVSDVSNKRNFTLLGDPALKLSYPRSNVYTTHVNEADVNVRQDTIRSLQEVKIRGYVGDDSGQILDRFNGFVYPMVYDKSVNVQTLNNDGGKDFNFSTFKNVLYRGKANVTDGLFEFSFVVPYDINYSFGSGRISYYAISGSEDAHGFSESFSIGGTLDGAELDDQGPEISLYMNDSTFVSGGITDSTPIILAKIFDNNGVNTVGSGIGHDLKAVLDEASSNPLVLNDYYEADLNTYKSGVVRYQLSDLEEGNHKLRLKVWDVHNNSSEAYTDFVVASNAEMALEHVLNYPNPFTTRTEFFFEHNKACAFLDVQIQIFTVSGKVVKTIQQTVQSEGFRSEGIVWDGRDDYGDRIGKGVYVYRLKVVTPDGEKAEKFEKLVILR